MIAYPMQLRCVESTGILQVSSAEAFQAQQFLIVREAAQYICALLPTAELSVALMCHSHLDQPIQGMALCCTRDHLQGFKKS